MFYLSKQFLISCMHQDSLDQFNRQIRATYFSELLLRKMCDRKRKAYTCRFFVQPFSSRQCKPETNSADIQVNESVLTTGHLFSKDIRDLNFSVMVKRS